MEIIVILNIGIKMLKISLKEGEEGFEVLKNSLIEDRESFLENNFIKNRKNIISLILLDRNVIFERIPEKSNFFIKNNIFWIRAQYPSALSSSHAGRYEKPVLFPKGELLVSYSRSFTTESLAKRDWIINEIPYALINSILKLKGNEEYKNIQLKGRTVLYKNKKVLGEETFYNSSSVFFDCQIHLDWNQESWNLYNKYCSEFKSVYEKGNLLSLLNISKEKFLEVFISELENLEFFIKIME